MAGQRGAGRRRRTRRHGLTWPGTARHGLGSGARGRLLQSHLQSNLNLSADSVPPGPARSRLLFADASGVSPLSHAEPSLGPALAARDDSPLLDYLL